MSPIRSPFSADDAASTAGQEHDSDDLNDELAPDKLLSGFELEALVRTLKRQQETAIKLVEQPGKGTDHAKIYEVSERWASTHLANGPSTRLVDDAFALELALREVGTTMILLSRDHDIAPEQLERLCRRAPRGKTIFIDISK